MLILFYLLLKKFKKCFEENNENISIFFYYNKYIKNINRFNALIILYIN